MARFHTILLFLLMCFSSARSETPYVIMISLDGFRWDYPDRGLTPTLDSIRAHGTTASSLQPAFPSKTFPNHLTIVTGLYPANHGLYSNNVYDPYRSVRYRLGDSTAIRDSRWYWGEMFWETAERQGITTASYFWPGSELPEDHRRPTYRELYDHHRPHADRVAGILDWLSLPEDKRPHFLTLYFSQIDGLGHRYGPNSPEVNQGIAHIDSVLGDLFTGIRRVGLQDQTNVIIVSDHGMTEVDTLRMIDVEKGFLKDIDCYTIDGGPFIFLTPKDASKTEELLARLHSGARHFKAYRTEETPEWFHLRGHPFLPPIVLIADMGWSLYSTSAAQRLKERPGGGNHGYDNFHLDMHGLFYAIGPNFKSGYRTGTVQNIDIYPLLCQIFRILPRQNIDGNLNRIGFMLKAD